MLEKEKIHFELANEHLKNGIDAFCLVLQTEKIAYADINLSGRVWGYIPLLKCFNDIFDPIIEKIFSENRSLKKNNLINKLPLPFSKFLLGKESCRELADLLKISVLEIENLINTQFSNNPIKINKINENDVIEFAESLELLSFMLIVISDQLNIKEELSWCSICFRRAFYNSKYCKLHIPEKDTNYRKGLKIKRIAPKEYFDQFLRNRSIKKLLGENFNQISAPSELLKQVDMDDFHAVSIHLINLLISDTKNQNWNVMCGHWDQLLTLLPNVSKQFNQIACNSFCWEDFTKKLIKSLLNPFEDTSHPYWIILMLHDAEVWLSIENNLKKNKTTINEIKILELINEGYSNSEIALRLDLSRQYVNKVRNLNK